MSRLERAGRAHPPPVGTPSSATDKISRNGVWVWRRNCDEKANKRTKINFGATASSPAPNGPRRSGQQGPAVAVVFVGHPGQRVEVAAAERGDVVDHGLTDQPGLGRLELALDVLLETGEHQPHVQ